MKKIPILASFASLSFLLAFLIWALFKDVEFWRGVQHFAFTERDSSNGDMFQILSANVGEKTARLEIMMARAVINGAFFALLDSGKNFITYFVTFKQEN